MTVVLTVAAAPSCTWTVRCPARATHVVSRRVSADEVVRRRVCPAHLEVAQSLGYEPVEAIPGPSPEE